jgi:hypothetical protein
MKRKRKYPVSEIEATVAWFKLKKRFNSVGMYPKRRPRTHLGLWMLTREYIGRITIPKKQYKIPGFVKKETEYIVGEQGPEPILTSSNCTIGGRTTKKTFLIKTEHVEHIITRKDVSNYNKNN